MIHGAGAWENEAEPVHEVEKKAVPSRRETSPVPKKAVGPLLWVQGRATPVLLTLTATQWFAGLALS